MFEPCIIILTLSGIALVTNVAICLYTLHLAKQAEHRQYMESFTSAFIQYECEAHGIRLSNSQPEYRTPENSNTKTKEE